MSLALTCTQVDCPVSLDGRCLEGLDDPSVCPNSAATPEETGRPEPFETGASRGSSSVHAEMSGTETVPAPIGGDDPSVSGGEIEWVRLGGDRALSLDEAHAFAQLAPCRVVLMAGEQESGKTTLAVELYAQFLRGEFAETAFGGSRTLRAFDSRHHPARELSGEPRPTTDRTADDDMRLLHLRLRRHGHVQDVLISDVSGEFFENIVDGGGSVVADVPLAARADLCLVTIDGAALADRRQRQAAVTRARQLVGGLASPGGVRSTASVVAVVTKTDLLTAPDLKWAGEQLDRLVEWAAGRAVQIGTSTVAARPSVGAAQGLEAIIDLILPAPVPMPRARPRPEAGDRQFWNQAEPY